MAVFRLDDYIAEAKHDPYELDCGGQGRFVIEYPNGVTLTQLTETSLNQTRRVIELLTGDQFDQIFAILAPLPGNVLIDFANDCIEHFGLKDMGKSREARRALRRS